jgi:2-keto-3-deoxy-L-rhamnonate aldolase RhmA|tara:strand:+ start:891 stop:1577 length:687 start_codon:yes stop_codon:yes gene_type:complete
MILTWQQIPSPLVSEIMCHEYDGVVLDTEHGCYGLETLYSCIQVVKALNKKCLVRLTEVSKTMIRYCLDAGVDGLIFSTIETKEQCQKILDCCYYSPKGKRGLGLVRQNFWGEKQLIQEQPIIIPQIETKTAVDNLEEILKFNFDYYLIGPYDLSLSLNVPAKFDNDQFLCYINKIMDLIPQSKTAVHIPNDIENQIRKYENCAIKCLGMDTIAILEYNKRSINNVKF